MVCELKVACLKIVYLVPHCSTDSRSFADPAEYKVVWDCFGQYDATNCSFYDLSSTMQGVYQHPINFGLSKAQVDHSPSGVYPNQTD